MDGKLLVMAPPDCAVRLGKGDMRAYPIYRIGNGSRLLRMGRANPRGGAMVVDTRGVERGADVQGLCRQIVRECRMREFAAVVCTGVALKGLVTELDGVLVEQGLEFYVPERLGEYTERARVMIGTAMSGGSLTCRLQEAVTRFGGPQRVALWVERVAEDFLLPAPTGCGRVLGEGELTEWMERRKPAVFFSEDLCARYFTYMSPEGGAHFVLFDDRDTIRKKLQLGYDLGIAHAVVRWEDVRDMR